MVSHDIMESGRAGCSSRSQHSHQPAISSLVQQSSMMVAGAVPLVVSVTVRVTVSSAALLLWTLMLSHECRFWVPHLVKVVFAVGRRVGRSGGATTGMAAAAPAVGPGQAAKFAPAGVEAGVATAEMEERMVMFGRKRSICVCRRPDPWRRLRLRPLLTTVVVFPNLPPSWRPGRRRRGA